MRRFHIYGAGRTVEGMCAGQRVAEGLGREGGVLTKGCKNEGEDRGLEWDSTS